MEKPLLTVVVPWANRPELGQTLAANGSLLRNYGADILIVNCGDPEDLRRQVEGTLRPLPGSISISVRRSHALSKSTPLIA